MVLGIAVRNPDRETPIRQRPHPHAWPGRRSANPAETVIAYPARLPFRRDNVKPRHLYGNVFENSHLISLASYFGL